jgi:hypothetical protein
MCASLPTRDSHRTDCAVVVAGVEDTARLTLWHPHGSPTSRPRARRADNRCLGCRCLRHPVIDQWIATAGDQQLIDAQGDRWIKPQETLEEYAYVVGATVEEVLAAGDIEEPVGMAVSDSSLFVADHATGRIHEFSWDGFEPIGEIDTEAEGLSGLAYASSDDGGILYFTDADGDRVGRVQVG